MRCKRHISDSSSTVGVCATCLRDRLLSIIAAQAQSSHYHHHRSRNQVHAQLLAAAASVSSLEHNRKSDFDRLQSQSQQILFPRSVSPYVLRGRKLYEDDDDDEVEVVPDRRFYSTPQIGQMRNERKHHHHRHGGRFSFFTSLFKPRSEKSEFDFKLPHETKPSATSSSSSFSWFSSIRWKHKSKPPKTTTTTSERLPRRVVVMDRGMTPERMSCADADEFDEPTKIEFISDSCKRTPVRSAKPSSNISGMAFCMSPLVRASPARLWNQKSVPSDLIGFSGEIRSAGNPHLSAASSHCANRSRKLVDFGRASHHH